MVAEPLVQRQPRPRTASRQTPTVRADAGSGRRTIELANRTRCRVQATTHRHATFVATQRPAAPTGETNRPRTSPGARDSEADVRGRRRANRSNQQNQQFNRRPLEETGLLRRNCPPHMPAPPRAGQAATFRELNRRQQRVSEAEAERQRPGLRKTAKKRGRRPPRKQPERQRRVQ